MATLLDICSFLFVIIHIAAAQSACKTPDNLDGNCIVLQQCPPLYKMLISDPTLLQRNYLRDSQCGRDGRKVLVCCPNTFTVDDLPSGKNCGTVVHDKIVGGERAGLTEFPWLTMLQYRKPNGRKSFLCGGSLIHESYVLTAAHCLNNPSLIRNQLTVISVRLGENDLRSDPDCLEVECALPVQDIPIDKSIVHEKYDPITFENDIALIRLLRPAIFNNSTKPVCLPIRDLQNKNYDRVQMSIGGFGQTESGFSSDTKQKLNVFGVNWDECAGTYRRLASTALGSNVICAGGEEGKDSCKGDSGGPMVAEATNNGDTFSYLVGVVSLGPAKCGQLNFPGVYTRVDRYLDWILDHMHN